MWVTWGMQMSRRWPVGLLLGVSVFICLFSCFTNLQVSCRKRGFSGKCFLKHQMLQESGHFLVISETWVQVLCCSSKDLIPELVCLPSQQSGLDLEFPMTEMHVPFGRFLLHKSCQNWCSPDKFWWQSFLNWLYLWSLIWDEGVITFTVWEKKHWDCSCFILKSKCESFRKSLVWNSKKI